MNEQTKSTELKLSGFYDGKNHGEFVDLVKFLLMPFVFFALLGCPVSGLIGNYINAISNFAGLAFFVFCGFFTLVPNREWRLRKLKRAVKRSWVFFAILFVGYSALSILYRAYTGSLGVLISPEFLRGRTIFDFLVLNVWPLPVGTGIWFAQSLAYAYSIFFFMEKFNLFRKYIYLPLLGILLAFMLFSGEFAKIVGFPYLGYSSIPGGFLTKAIPFMLIGMLLRKYVDRLARIPRFVHIITFFAGILCAVGELFLLAKHNNLVSRGNMIGYAIMALSVCCFEITKPGIRATFFGSHGASYARRMYALCQPISFLIWFVFCLIDPESSSAITQTVMQFNSIICFAVCLFLAFLFGIIKFRITLRRKFIKNLRK